MAQTERVRKIPKSVKRLPIGQRIRWARAEHAKLSHDKLVERLGRSNRGHIIKIERGEHVPRRDLRDAIADACGVPRDLFYVDDDEEDASMALSRDLHAAIDRIVQARLEREMGRS